MSCPICHVDLTTGLDLPTELTNNPLQEHCNESYPCLIAIMKEQVKGYARKREHIEQTARQRAEEKEQQKQAEQEEQKKAELARQEAQKRADPEVAKAEILKAKQRLQELRQRRAQREAIEAARPIPTLRDIGIFDPTLICDILEFGLYSKVVGFLQNLQQIQHQYLESDVLDLLPKCLRGPAFAWFKSQSSFTTIQDFGRGLACAFPTISFESTAKTSAPPVSQPPTQYHSCVECSAQFSSMSRLLEHTRQETACCNIKAICKHCEQGFNSKNKLHDHIREHHAQKPAAPPATSKNSNLRPPTPESTYKTEEKPAVICPLAPLAPLAPSAPLTPPATPKSISCPASISESVSPKGSHLPIATPNITPKQAEIASMLATRGFTPKRAEIAALNCPLAPPTPPATPTSISEPVSSECSHLPIATRNITPKSMEKLPANSLAPPASPPRTPVRKHQEPHVQKPYLTIDDLIRMFRGKPRPFGLRQHQKGLASPQSPGTRPPSQPRSPYQSRITAYFLPAANQKAPISQGLKSPNPKSFQQHMPAEPIRPASALPEKSAFSPYKKPGISYTSLQSRSSSSSSFLQSRSSFAWPPPTSPPSFRSPSPDLHVCCTCFGHSSFRNGLFDYPRPSHRYPSNRRPMREGGVRGMVSRFGAKLGGNER